jgi:hypothetical protein
MSGGGAAIVCKGCVGLKNDVLFKCKASASKCVASRCQCRQLKARKVLWAKV